ncbi:hypothetical protein HOB30_03030 [Candidatus Falkowbacteria bacterium]|jgi:hypothetical protein|nr:hypothetical protein [Candidatus Falkowbacteria bacterium]
MSSDVINKLFKNLSNSAPQTLPGDKIKVHSVISTASFAYEKIRNAVDYNEEHLVRKNAIYRILKRKLMLEKVILENYLLDKYHAENMSEQLLQELIRGRYIKDVPKSMILEIDEIITKYNNLITKVKETSGNLDKKYFQKLLEMAAVEIEQRLIPPKREKSLATSMFSVMNPKIELADDQIDEKEKELQLYINTYRVLFKWDDIMIRYLLLTLFYPDWHNADEKLITKIANNIDKVNAQLDKHLNHPWKKRIIPILNKKAIVFHVLNDVWDNNQKNIDDIVNDNELLESEIKKACEKRYKGVRVKLNRGVVRSIIYVFFTKMLLALVLEFPYDYYLAGEINYQTVSINILFPPILMFLVAIMISMPKKENTQEIMAQVKSIISHGCTTKKFILKNPKSRGKAAGFVFNLIYTATFVLSIFVLFGFLFELDFNLFSSLIFILFLTLVSFFGIRIRRPVKELLAIEKRDSLISSVIDFFALPFVSMGRWMSTKFSRINFFAFLMDFIIEAPFKLLISVFEDLFGFLKEKKEDVMSE